MPTPLQTAKSRLGSSVRWGTPEEAVEARRALNEAKITAYVQRTLAEAPPLTDEQRARLASLFSSPHNSGHRP